jgi:tripartite-type tricarboxylate transporter receptor subunit TctC
VFGCPPPQVFIAKTYGRQRDLYWKLPRQVWDRSRAKGLILRTRECLGREGVSQTKSPKTPGRADVHDNQANLKADRLLSRRSFNAAIACVAAVTPIFPAAAQTATSYPQKPVRIFVPYGPGGVGDLTMRLLADKLSQDLKQQFVIENRPGAGGIVNMTEVLRARADGYTLGEVGNGQAISVSLFEKLAYNVLTDFAPISITASFEILLAVPDTSPYKSLSDVVDLARKNPDKLTLGAINPGSTQNLSAHLFQQVTGAEYTIVPYRTTPDLVTALLRSDVDLGFDFYAGLQGELGPDKIRIIATSGEQRDPLLKDAPTAKESGFPDYIVTSWNGLVAPAKVPPEIINVLNAAVNRALSDPELKAKARNLGIDASGSTPQQMHDRLAADVIKWRDVIEKAHIPKQ